MHIRYLYGKELLGSVQTYKRPVYRVQVIS